MALYRENAVAGSSYRRAVRVIMENQLGKMPKILYIEEDVLTVGNTVQTTVLTTPLGGVVNPAGTIELRDQTTKLPTGQHVSAAMVYAALYSDYLNRAEARDAEEQALLAQTLQSDTNTVVSDAPDATIDAPAP